MARVKQFVYVDLPNVGEISQEDATDIFDNDPVGILVLAAIWLYSEEARTWSGMQANLRESQRNALKHSAWMALCSSDIVIGSNIALYFGTAHEFTNKQGGAHAYESTMDLHNNREGSTIYHPVLKPPIFSDLRTKLTNGELWIWDSPGPEHTGLRTTIRSDLSKIYPSEEQY